MFEEVLSLNLEAAPQSEEHDRLIEVMRNCFADWHAHYRYSDEADFVFDLGDGNAFCIGLHDYDNNLCVGFFLRRLTYSPATQEEPAFLADYPTQDEHEQAWAEHRQLIIDTFYDTADELTHAGLSVMRRDGNPVWHVSAGCDDELTLELFSLMTALLTKWENELRGKSMQAEGA